MSATTTLRMVLLGEDRSAGKALRGVGSEADQASTKMGKFHKVGTAAGVALAGGLALAGKAAVDMTKAAADDQLSSEKMAQTFRKAAGATKQQIAATENWITVQGKSKGVADDELRPALSRLVAATHNVGKAQHLAGLAMNVSAGTGKSLKSVAEALAKAQAGNVSGLSRLGVVTKDATGKTLSLHQITKQLSDTYGGAAAKAADTAAGKQKILSVQMGELQEQIGYALIPVMQKLTSVGLSVVNWISHNTKVAGILVGVIGGLLAVTWAVSTAIKVWSAVTKVAAAVQWLLNAALDANPIGLVVIAIAALVVALVIAYKHSETFRHIVQAAFHAVAAVADAVFNWIKGHWKLLLAILVGPIGAAVIVIISHWSKIKAATAAVWSAIKGIVSTAWAGIRAVVNAQIDLLLGAIRAIPAAISRVGGAFMHAGAGLIHSLFNGVVAAARSGAGFVAGLIGSIKSAVNSALNLPLRIDFDKGPIHIHQTVIPALAKGGIVNSPTLALIGEAGPEAVVPLSGPNAPGGLMGGSNGDLGTVAVDLRLDGKTMQTVLLRLKRQNGNLSLGLA